MDGHNKIPLYRVYRRERDFNHEYYVLVPGHDNKLQRLGDARKLLERLNEEKQIVGNRCTECVLFKHYG